MGDCCIYDRFEQCFHNCTEGCCPQATKREVVCTRCGCDMYADEPYYREWEVCEDCYEEMMNEEE